MARPSSAYRVGLDYLEAVTALLNRIRTMHPTGGLFEAAELQWWWGQMPRKTDDVEQLFWFDDAGRPEAAVILTDWGEVAQLDPIVLPDASPEWVVHVMQRGIDHARALGFDKVQLEVDKEDAVLRAELANHGFAFEEQGVTEAWMAADARPEVSALHDGYRLFDRGSVLDRPHHMINERRNHMDSEPRLRQTSLYRPDLDLVVYDSNDEVSGYGLFWYNPATEVGVVEPMRTEDNHQKKGIARHILTAGIDRLADAGAKRIRICFEPGNDAAKHLYLSVGFEPIRDNDVLAGRTTA